MKATHLEPLCWGGQMASRVAHDHTLVIGAGPADYAAAFEV